MRAVVCDFRIWYEGRETGWQSAPTGATDAEIDRLVCELYGLSDDEIRLVEEEIA